MLILFIDDDNEDYELFCEASQNIDPGIECVFRHNGVSAVRFLNETTRLPDCIFLDVNMPIMGGVECLKEIRANESLKDIPVIIFSAASNPATNYTKLGANEVLVKPSNYNCLVELLRGVLQRLGQI